jgi:primosomal protein N'
MPLSKCPRSGKLFDNTLGPVHPDVMEEEQADYQRILDYIAEHPNCKTEDAAKATGVDIGCLQRLVKQGRVAALSQEDLRAQEEENQKRAEEIAKRNARLAQDLQRAASTLKEAGPQVKIGSVHNTLEEKRQGRR